MGFPAGQGIINSGSEKVEYSECMCVICGVCMEQVQVVFTGVRRREWLKGGLSRRI